MFSAPLKVETSLEIIESWLKQPSVVVVHPGPRHLALLRELLVAGGGAGNLTNDAAPAALRSSTEPCCVPATGTSGGFQGLTWTDPLA